MSFPRLLTRWCSLSIPYFFLMTTPNAVAQSGDTFRDAERRGSNNRKLETTLKVDLARYALGQQRVEMRSYEGGPVGPTLRVKPGDMLIVNLDNRLRPMTQPTGCQDEYWNTYNTTNLHTHGLHVSPAGNSDNVLIRVEPGKKFRNEIYIPEDHPPGTFWYHAHVHGSTAIQVGSGMAGALIVEGGLDDVPEIRDAARERIFVFQQVPYTVGRDGIGRFECVPPGPPPPVRATTINGALLPNLVLAPGSVERWRFIHGGIFSTLKLGLRKKGGSETLTFHELSRDGFAFGDMRDGKQILLYPGYRSDVLVKAPIEDGDYELVDLESAIGEAVWDQVEAEGVIATVEVKGDPRPMPLPPPERLAPLVPFPPIAHLTGPNQIVMFQIHDGKYTINGHSFPDGPVRKLLLGQAAEWYIGAVGTPNIAHPFHIHVNPFEIVEPDGKRHWKDTLTVFPGQRIAVRSRYERYIGRFVLHCHNLIHEDRGMMQLVEILLNEGEDGHGHGGGESGHE